MSQTVVVFIDAQNMYQGARRAFFARDDYHIKGQFRPDALGQLLADSGKPSSDRTLKEVRAYSGRPDSTKQPKAHSAHMKQCAGWAANGVTVVTRSLRYSRRWPQEREREKGVDVALAIDFVSMATDNEYDVGILVSVDTDMTPALEYVAKKYSPMKTVEVAAWYSDGARGRLGVKGEPIWCHRLTRDLYDRVVDPTDYTQ